MSEKHPWTFVTAAFAVNAAGNAIPPSLIFPRVKFHQHFLRDGPTGCDGDANPSGWMMEQNFVKFTKHFVSYARCSEKRPSLLLLDNHDSHLSAEALDYFKANAVTLLSFPPHCSHKLQPLDRSVYGPLKKQINTACDAWVCTNKRPMTIYDIPSILARAALLALTPVNIMAGFKVSGIFPLNPEIFTDSDFMPSYFTDRPAPAVPNLENTNNPKQISNLPEQRLFIALIQTHRKHQILLHQRRLALPKKLFLRVPLKLSLLLIKKAFLLHPNKLALHQKKLGLLRRRHLGSKHGVERKKGSQLY